MSYIVVAVVSLLAGVAGGALIWRKNGAKVEDAAAKIKSL